MSASSFDLEIDQGSSFYRKLILQDEDEVPVDLTGSTFRGQIRRFPGDIALLAQFTCTVLDQTTNEGEVEVTLTAAQTAALPTGRQGVPQRRDQTYAYDIERVFTDGTVQRVMQGLVTMSPEVTR